MNIPGFKEGPSGNFFIDINSVLRYYSTNDKNF